MIYITLFNADVPNYLCKNFLHISLCDKYNVQEMIKINYVHSAA